MTNLFKFIFVIALPLTLVACDKSEEKASSDRDSGNVHLAAHNSEVAYANANAKKITTMSKSELQDFKNHVDNGIAQGENVLFYASQPNIRFDGKNEVRTNVENLRRLSSLLAILIKEKS